VNNSSASHVHPPPVEYDFGDEFNEPPAEELPVAALPPPPASLPLPPPPAMGRPPSQEVDRSRKRKSRWDTMSGGQPEGDAQSAQGKPPVEPIEPLGAACLPSESQRCPEIAKWLSIADTLFTSCNNRSNSFSRLELELNRNKVNISAKASTCGQCFSTSIRLPVSGTTLSPEEEIDVHAGYFRLYCQNGG
jgi:hypothetical protein